MRILYSLAIWLYSMGIVFSSLFNKKAKLWLDGRKDILKKIIESVNPGEQIIWFHAASLGEFEQGRPLMEAIRNQFPEFKILLTFFSPSGYEIRKNYQGADYIFYLPLDSVKNASEFIESINPVKVFFVKYEFWYYYLKMLNKKKIPVYLISAIFRENQVFFKWYGSWYRKILAYFDHIFVQNDESLNLLSKYSLTHISKSGDTRFDRVAEISKQTKTIDIAEKFCDNKTVVICGSTWDKDEEILIRYINHSNDSIKFIIAPHEIQTTHIQRIVAGLKKQYILFSEANHANITDKQVLIINNIGMLSSLYQYGHWAYIGGGFGVGIHNILEAAAFNLPVVFGPNYHKFKEAVDLIRLKGAFCIKDFAELAVVFNDLSSDKEKRQYSGNIAGKYVVKNQGAASRIMQEVFGDVPK